MFNDKIIDEIKELLITHHETIAVAESVTAGQLQVALASAENASQFFQGGITVYNLGQKARHLQIEPIHAEQCNSVSEQVAAQMALNVTPLFMSDWGIGITGYAAPVPERSVDQPFAYYAVSYRGNILRGNKMQTATKDAMEVQIYFVNKILQEFGALVKSQARQSSFSIKDLNSMSSRFASAGPFKTSPSTE